MLATLGEKVKDLEFACRSLGCRLEIFMPRQFFTDRKRGMRRRILREELMIPGYLFCRGDVGIVLSSRLSRMKSLGSVKGIEVARLYEQERQSFENANAELRQSRNPSTRSQSTAYELGERVWCARGLFRGVAFIVQAQRGREVRLVSEEPVFMGSDEIVVDVGVLSRTEVKICM